MSINIEGIYMAWLGGDARPNYVMSLSSFSEVQQSCAFLSDVGLCNILEDRFCQESFGGHHIVRSILVIVCCLNILY